MSFVQVLPVNSGGGVKRQPPGGKLHASGQLTLNHAAADLLELPDRVLVEYAIGQHALRLSLAMNTDTGAFAVTGGGNTQNKIKVQAFVKANAGYVGDYTAELVKGKLVLTRGVIDLTAVQWRRIKPSASSSSGGSAAKPAVLKPSGALVLGGAVVTTLGSPSHVLVHVDVVAKVFRIVPCLEGAEGAWSLTGQGGAQRRVTLTALLQDNADLAGEYKPRRIAGAVELVKLED